MTGLTNAEHFAWAKGRALELLDQGDAPGAMATFELDLAKHPGTAGILHPELRNLMYSDYIQAGGKVEGTARVRQFIETLAGPRLVGQGEDFLTVKEIADVLRVSGETVYRMIRVGELEHVRAGKSIRIPRKAAVDLVGWDAWL